MSERNDGKVKAGEILDRIIRANYILLFWVTVFALVGLIVLLSTDWLESAIPPFVIQIFSK